IVSLSSHSACFGECARSVSDHASPPCALISQSCIGDVSGFALGRARELMKAIFSPSGDHFGCMLLSAPRVSAISCASPVRLERYRLAMRPSLSLSPADLVHASHLPSGETLYWPTASS